MNSIDRSTDVWDIYAEDVAAELTLAAYRVALRHDVIGDPWIKLELDLWRVLTDAVDKWRRRSPRGIGQPEAVDGQAHDHSSVRRRLTPK